MEYTTLTRNELEWRNTEGYKDTTFYMAQKNMCYERRVEVERRPSRVMNHPFMKAKIEERA